MTGNEVIDVEVINQLKVALGEDAKEIIDDLIQTYVGDAPNLINGMRESIKEQDTEKTRRFAHTLKGSSANLGLNELANACFVLEKAAKNEDLANAEEMLAYIEDAYERALQALNEVI